MMGTLLHYYMKTIRKRNFWEKFFSLFQPCKNHAFPSKNRKLSFCGNSLFFSPIFKDRFFSASKINRIRNLLHKNLVHNYTEPIVANGFFSVNKNKNLVFTSERDCPTKWCLPPSNHARLRFFRDSHVQTNQKGLCFKKNN